MPKPSKPSVSEEIQELQDLLLRAKPLPWHDGIPLNPNDWAYAKKAIDVVPRLLRDRRRLVRHLEEIRRGIDKRPKRKSTGWMDAMMWAHATASDALTDYEI